MYTLVFRVLTFGTIHSASYFLGAAWEFKKNISNSYRPFSHYGDLGDRIRRPEHPTENEVRRRSCDESV